MSKASASGQIYFDKILGTITLDLNSNTGRIYQDYEGSEDNPINVAPDFATSRPLLELVPISSNAADGIIVPSAVKWYFNGSLLTFGEDRVSTNSFYGETGHFEFVPYQAGTQNYYGLRIIKNLVKAANMVDAKILAEADFTRDSYTRTVKAQYDIPVNKVTANQIRVVIVAPDNKNFTIREKGESVQMKAVARIGATELNSGLVYKWYRMESGTWTLLPDKNTQTITVESSLVDSKEIFKVEVVQNDNVIGLCTQEVADATDPYEILLNPVPENMTISKPGDTVVFTPVVVKRGTTEKAVDTLFFFTFTDLAGVILNPDTNTVAAVSGTITYDMCEHVGTGPLFYIESEQ